MDEPSQGEEQTHAFDSGQTESALYVDRDPVEDEWIEPAGWPKVVGIISIVLGGLMLSCMGCGLGVQALIAPMQTQLYPDGMPPAALHPPLMMYASALVGGIVNVLLIIAGSTLLMRRPTARRLFLIYVVTGFLSAAFGIFTQLQMQVEITEWVKQNPDTKYSRDTGGRALGQVVGLVIGMVFGFAWPAFCLIWFGAVKRDASEIERGIQQVV